MNWTFFVKGYSAVEFASSTEHVQSRLPIVTLVGVVHVSMCEDENESSERVLLDLALLRFEKVLLASWWGQEV